LIFGRFIGNNKAPFLFGGEIRYYTYMLKLFSGNDHKAIKKALAPLVVGSQKEGTYRRHAGDITVPMLDPYFSESLFGETYLVLLDGLSLFSEEVKIFLLAQVGMMSDSSHQFIVVDEKFSKEFRDEAKKYKIPIELFSVEERSTGLSVFTFTDLYLGRDKKGAWLALTRLFREGAAPEEVHGALFWAIKSLYLAVTGSLGNDPTALGMKPFTYEKSKRFGAKWTREEVSETLKHLSSMLESTRKTGGDLGIALERLVLL